MKAQQRGVTTVEFAVVGALFFTLLLGSIEVGRAMFVWNTLTEATRRGARVAAVCGINHPAIARVTVFGDPRANNNNSPILPNLTTANVAVAYLNAAGAPTAVFTQIASVQVSIVNYQHNMLIPFVGRLLNAPPFATTLPSESLGVVPGVGSNRCDFP